MPTLMYVKFLAILCFSISFFTGIVVWKVLPKGTGTNVMNASEAHQVFLGMTDQEWFNFHVVSSISFSVLVVFHILLYSGPKITSYRKKKKLEN